MTWYSWTDLKLTSISAGKLIEVTFMFSSFASAWICTNKRYKQKKIFIRQVAKYLQCTRRIYHGMLYEHREIYKIVQRRPLLLAEFVSGKATNGCLTLQSRKSRARKHRRKSFEVGNLCGRTREDGGRELKFQIICIESEGKKKPGRPIKYTVLLTSSWRSRCSFPADVLTSLR